MNKKNILMHICAVVIFIAASFVYFSPAVFDNKQINQSDMSQVQGMNTALADYTKATGKHSEWTPNMFSGMPSYQIEYGKAGNVFQYIMQPLTLGKYQMSAGIFFLLALGFYVFMVCMGANSWLALFAGLIYALGSYNIIIIGVGHITKAWAMAMIAPVLGGMILVMRRKYTAGSIVFTLSLALQLTFNHIQITYYTLITAVILGISYFCFAVKEKELKNFAFSVLALICCAFIALLPSVGHLSVNNEYAKHTMRGGSELTVHPTSDAGNINKNGLDIDYAFKWSYGKGETMTVLIADYKGGGSADTRVSENDSPILKNRADAFKNNTPLQTNPQALQQVANHYFSSSYYGDQPFTAGPVYFGSIVVFLALLGFLILDNKWRWWL
ncbi:MAG: hypothetical protein IJ250_07305, partial [Bacteroidales bacterium]|nr:hypothetical protein [Bacteroidales bacterium]